MSISATAGVGYTRLLAPPSGTIVEYAISGLPIISNICVGADNNLWFSLEGGTPAVGKITTAGVSTLYPVGTSGDNFGGINPGPDGNIWLTDFTQGTILKISTSNGSVLASYAPSAGPAGIVAGSDGNMWCTMSVANKVCRITISGTITEFTVPTASSFPHGPNLGWDGNVWFCEESAAVNKIAYITPSGTITAFGPTPTSGSQPYVIARGGDGNMWFTEITGNKIGRITETGVITEFSVPTASSQPGGICRDTNGNVWFVEKHGNKIGKIQVLSPNTITEYTIPTASSNPDKIVLGPDGNMWFTEHDSGKIGRITP